MIGFTDAVRHPAGGNGQRSLPAKLVARPGDVSMRPRASPIASRVATSRLGPVFAEGAHRDTPIPGHGPEVGLDAHKMITIVYG
jgi:hypothetical protein